ncbi:hypothetical protein [Parvibaculum sp.]|uniref:hypothetical protein n=1 Tax=Parvibaculum sp. TaxID=2024848 RepID=UPI0038B3416D
MGIALLVGASSEASEKGRWITGNKFIELDDILFQTIIATSVLEGYEVGIASAAGPESDSLNRLEACVDGWTAAQIRAVVLKYLEDKPSIGI